MKKEQQKKKTDVKTDGQAKSKGSQVIQPASLHSKPQKVEIRQQEVDQATMTRVFERYTKERKEAASQNPMMTSFAIDEKSRLLMDRVKKTPMKAEKSEMFADEMSSFHRKSKQETKKKKKKKQEDSVFLDDEDSYATCKRWTNPLQKKTENDREKWFMTDGAPVWTMTMEPTEKEMEGVDEPITAGTEHIELYHEKKINLYSIGTQKLTLDEYQPLKSLRKRDELFTDFRLVFSNTIRSIVFLCTSDETKRKNREELEKKIEKSGERTIRFEPVTTPVVIYSRSNPIQSIREAVAGTLTPPTLTTTTTTTSTASCD